MEESSRDQPWHLSPIGHDWERKDDHLSAVRTENKLHQESVLKFVTCTCRKLNCTNFCQCRILSIEFTDVFKCLGLCGHIIYDSVESDKDGVEEDNENDIADEIAWNSC